MLVMFSSFAIQKVNGEKKIRLPLLVDETASHPPPAKRVHNFGNL